MNTSTPQSGKTIFVEHKFIVHQRPDDDLDGDLDLDGELGFRVLTGLTTLCGMFSPLCLIAAYLSPVCCWSANNAFASCCCFLETGFGLEGFIPKTLPVLCAIEFPARLSPQLEAAPFLIGSIMYSFALPAKSGCLMARLYFMSCFRYSDRMSSARFTLTKREPEKYRLISCLFACRRAFLSMSVSLRRTSL